MVSWVLKTRQGSEAGKEILLREALASHMRSTRDRQLFAELLRETQPIEDVFSFFASFYLHSYQGVRLLNATDAPELTTEGTDDLAHEERRQLELEIRQIYGNNLRQEIDTARVTSELVIRLCNELGGKDSSSAELKDSIISIVKEYLKKIPSEYTSNHDIDLILEVTGWSQKWREELYAKASGLKESSLSLRDELLREHPSEVPETTVLKTGLQKILGRTEYAKGRLGDPLVPATSWNMIVEAITERFCKKPSDLEGVKNAHKIRVELLEVIEEDYDTPTTIDDFERRLSERVAGSVTSILASNPAIILNTLSHLCNISEDDLRAQLRRKGIDDPSVITSGLQALSGISESTSAG